MILGHIYRNNSLGPLVDSAVETLEILTPVLGGLSALPVCFYLLRFHLDLVLKYFMSVFIKMAVELKDSGIRR